MELPRPSLHGNRPAYLDKLFHESASCPPPIFSPSAHSTNSSISSLHSDQLAGERNVRPFLRGFDTDSLDDRISVRSLKLHLSPRFKIRTLFSRRTIQQVQETVDFEASETSTSYNPSPPKFSPLLRPQTSWSSPSRKRHPPRLPSVPSAPVAKVEQLHCTPCYYFAARNCHGYVLGGDHGDACENCAVRIRFSPNVTQC